MLSEALTCTEQAVELEPRDVGYRMVRADLYLKNGRFRSAATSFKDVLTLNPSNERAALSLAFTQIALGNSYQATAQLDGLTETAKPGDIGLAYALAGQPERAIAMLEPAARAPRSEEHTSELQSLMRISYAVFCLKKK